VRGTACLCTAASVPCSRSTAQQTATTAVGVELGSHDGLDGTIGFDGRGACWLRAARWRVRFEAIVPPGSITKSIGRAGRRAGPVKPVAARRSRPKAFHDLAVGPRLAPWAISCETGFRVQAGPPARSLSCRNEPRRAGGVACTSVETDRPNLVAHRGRNHAPEPVNRGHDH